MLEVRRLGPRDWALWREVRLASLAESPHAYGSTLARERAFDEPMWRARLAASTGGRDGVATVALVDGRAVGAVGGYVAAGASAPLLIGLWAHPAHRGRGVADALVDDLVAWAREHGWASVRTRVVVGNAPAWSLFARHGFIPTGRREPLASDPRVSTETLVRTV